MFESILHLQNPHWSGQAYINLFERLQLGELIKKLALKEIQVLLGIRRSGKSTLFKLIINHLLQKNTPPEELLYINLDDPFYVDVWKEPQLLYKVIETCQKLTGTKPLYLFLDEIQNVNDWEKFVKSVYDSELFKKIMITGSNFSLLKSDYATMLSGRYLIDPVMPLSFQEILHNEKIDTSLKILQEKSRVLALAERLLFTGGFPEVWKNQDSKLIREQLVSYYETIVLKDCISNHKIREIKKFKDLALYVLTNNGTLFSYNNLANAIGSNENSIKEFIQILEDSFLIHEVKHFSYSLKEQTKLPKKCFCADNGLIHAVSFRFSENRGKLFENLVYTELRKLGFNEIYYFTQDQECDFLISSANGWIAVQVTVELTSYNKEREIKGLTNAMKKLRVSKGYIITFDCIDEEELGENMFIVPFYNLNTLLRAC
ncbi:MAG: hypothetical protein A3F18_08745 [Legionellales bacterium RIFCSPHIGHO2_12_FULL_37_14]|nr:MAG: hypothetical protein A3F18_08745 [Legionellales bacterium RIFCSPHIGHO2_12_FULL_37_14]